MSADIQLPDLEIEPEPSKEELESLRKTIVDMRAFGVPIDTFFIRDAPENLYYEWGPADNTNLNRMASLGFKRNDALAARSTFLNPDRENGNMIQDVVCYTIHKKKKQMMDEAFEITKRLKADPRKTYASVVEELGSNFLNLPEKEQKENRRDILTGEQAQTAVMKDWVKSGQQLNKE